MQATGIDVLDRIVARRRERFGVTEPVSEAVRDPALPLPRDENPFLAALAARRGAAVIAEVKMGSPKLGSLVGTFDPEEQARTYATNGATALSVVVEPHFFHGSYELLSRCRRASGLPAIAKDFVVHRRQVEAALEAGASALLLIAALYDASELRAWAHHIRRAGMVPLVETHGAEDIAKLGGSPWELVGINNRDLRTFRVDLEHSLERVKELPPEALKVAESGIRTAEDVARLQAGGFDAYLVGESLVTAEDPAAKLRELAGGDG